MRAQTFPYGSSDGEVFLGKEFGHTKTYSEETAAKIDAEVKEYITDGYNKTEEILKEHTAELHEVAKFLFEHEKMTGEQFVCVMEGKPVPIEEDADEDTDEEYLSEEDEAEDTSADSDDTSDTADNADHTDEADDDSNEIVFAGSDDTEE